MPFIVLDILEMHNNDRERAISYCLSVATNFPLQRADYERYALTLRILKGARNDV